MGPLFKKRGEGGYVFKSQSRSGWDPSRSGAQPVVDAFTAYILGLNRAV